MTVAVCFNPFLQGGCSACYCRIACMVYRIQSLGATNRALLTCHARGSSTHDALSKHPVSTLPQPYYARDAESHAHCSGQSLHGCELARPSNLKNAKACTCNSNHCHSSPSIKRPSVRCPPCSGKSHPAAAATAAIDGRVNCCFTAALDTDTMNLQVRVAGGGCPDDLKQGCRKQNTTAARVSDIGE